MKCFIFGAVSYEFCHENCEFGENILRLGKSKSSTLFVQNTVIRISSQENLIQRTQINNINNVYIGEN